MSAAVLVFVPLCTFTDTIKVIAFCIFNEDLQYSIMDKKRCVLHTGGYGKFHTLSLQHGQQTHDRKYPLQGLRQTFHFRSNCTHTLKHLNPTRTVKTFTAVDPEIQCSRIAAITPELSADPCCICRGARGFAAGGGWERLTQLPSHLRTFNTPLGLSNTTRCSRLSDSKWK